MVAFTVNKLAEFYVKTVIKTEAFKPTRTATYLGGQNKPLHSHRSCTICRDMVFKNVKPACYEKFWKAFLYMYHSLSSRQNSNNLLSYWSDVIFR
jgi:hypothetical protein